MHCTNQSPIRWRLLLVASLALTAGACGSPGHTLRSSSAANALTSQPGDVSITDMALTSGPPIESAALDWIRARVAAATDRALQSQILGRFDWALVDAHEVRQLVVWQEQLVVATDGGLLFVADGRITDRLSTANGLKSNDVTSALAGPSGVLWIGFDGAGCQRLGDDGLMPCPAGARDRRWVDFVSNGSAVYGLAHDGQVFDLDGTVALDQVMTAHRLAFCNGSLWAATRGFGLQQVGSDTNYATERVVTALTCVDQVLFYGGPGGVHRLADGGVSSLGLDGGRRHVTAITSTRDTLLILTADGRLHRLDGEGDRRVEELPSTMSSMAVFEGELWLAGAHSDELLRLDGHGRLATLTLPGPGSTDVSSIATHTGTTESGVTAQTLAVSMFRRGLAIWSENGWNRVRASEGLPSSEVNHVRAGARGFWVATTAGLALVDVDGAVLGVWDAEQLPCEHINDVIPLAAGQLTEKSSVLVLTSCGVGLLDADGPGAVRVTSPVWWENTDHGLPHRIAYTAAIWDGRLVVGTNDGLAIRDTEDAERPWRMLRAGQLNTIDSWITALGTGPDGQLVVGTYSGGLYVGSDELSLRRAARARFVNLGAIYQDGDTTWVGGLEEGAYAISVDGLTRPLPAVCFPGDDVTGFAHFGGQLLASTRSGVGIVTDACLAEGLPPEALTVVAR